MCNACILANLENRESIVSHYDIYLKQTNNFDRYDPKNTKLLNSYWKLYRKSVKPFDIKLGEILAKCKDRKNKHV